MVDSAQALLSHYQLRVLRPNHFAVDNCASSNDIVQALAEAGFPHGSLVRAINQSQGRGRLGAQWFSSAQALQFSLLLRPHSSTQDLPFINILAAYTVMKLLYQQMRLPILMKWPNDLLLNNRKICGVMSEMRTGSAGTPYIVLGCGINLNVRQEEFPFELRSVATSVLIETGEKIEPNDFLNRWEELFFSLYDRYIKNF